MHEGCDKLVEHARKSIERGELNVAEGLAKAMAKCGANDRYDCPYVRECEKIREDILKCCRRSCSPCEPAGEEQLPGAG